MGKYSKAYRRLENFRSRFVEIQGGKDDGELGIVCQLRVAGRQKSFFVDAKAALVMMHHLMAHLDDIYDAADPDLTADMNEIDEHFRRSTDRHDCE